MKQSEYLIKYDDFTGPVTLLLDVIRKKKIDIYQVKISDIIQDFLDYIKFSKNVLLDTLSEFLYFITLLLEIKSSSIIPSQNRQEDEEESGLTDLVQLQKREKQYLAYKKIANYLLKMKEVEEIYYLRESPVEKQFIKIMPDFFNDLTVENMNKTASGLLHKNEYTIDLSKIRLEDATITILDAANHVKEIITKKREITFKEISSKYNLLIDKIICFLSILELYKHEYIDIVQFENFGNILIKKIEKD